MLPDGFVLMIFTVYMIFPMILQVIFGGETGCGLCALYQLKCKSRNYALEEIWLARGNYTDCGKRYSKSSNGVEYIERIR